MAYNQRSLKILGNIVANKKKKKIEELMEDYEKIFQYCFSKSPRYTSDINMLIHALGYFKKELSSKEKNFLLNSLQQYKMGRIPLCVPISIIKSWIIRFGQEYLMSQTFFEPYPEALIRCFPITDAEKNRDFWK